MPTPAVPRRATQTCIGCAAALVGIAWLAPLGNLLALLAATGALGVARAEEQRRIARGAHGAARRRSWR